MADTVMPGDAQPPTTPAGLSDRVPVPHAPGNINPCNVHATSTARALARQNSRSQSRTAASATRPGWVTGEDGGAPFF